MSHLWGPIKPNAWRHVSSVSARQATDGDVQEGRAVFYVDGQSEPYDIDLPCLGFQTMGDGTEVKVVIVQAEHSPNGPILGVRYFEGGNGVCSLREVRFE